MLSYLRNYAIQTKGRNNMSIHVKRNEAYTAATSQAVLTPTLNAHSQHSIQHALREMQAFDGWCAQEKARLMMHLIIATKPKVCAEIGVFAGRSAYPTLMALEYNRRIEGHKGVLHAIDSWNTTEAVRNYDSKDENAKWWKTIPIGKIHAQFVANLKKHNLTDLCVIHNQASQAQAAISKIPTIDILHIDGNHSEKSSVSDVLNYLPKVREGGYVWLNDSNWPTRKAAFAILLEKCDLVYTDQQGAFALLRKKFSEQEIKKEVVVIPTPTPASPAPQPIVNKKPAEEVKQEVIGSDEAPVIVPVPQSISEEKPAEEVKQEVIASGEAPEVVPVPQSISEEKPVEEVKQEVIASGEAPVVVPVPQSTSEEKPVEDNQLINERKFSSKL